ncbi:MAG: hypothetical protein GX410_05095, partial [Elusimicrobia bacterium]|nr:hypothetical protein [Elusimicrobiota bacterium]
MHHSWYLRPAFVAFAAYALLLSLQRHYFGPPNPPACDVCYQSPVPAGLQGRVKPFPRRNGEEVWFELDVEKNGGEAACG